MKHLIRKRQTQEFFRDGSWTRHSDLAQEFPDSTAVIHAVWENHLTDVELVLQLGAKPSDAYDIRLPILGPPTAGASSASRPGRSEQFYPGQSRFRSDS